MIDGHETYLKPGETKTEVVHVQDPTVQNSKPGISKKKVFGFVACSILSIAVWHNILVPSVQFFLPEYVKVSEELTPEISDLLEASKKNCQIGNYNRRGCKAVWAGVHIPQLTADGR
jgi:hypothetical protein